MLKQKQATKKANGKRVEGEGSYTATRSYNQGLARAALDKKSIQAGATRARRALEGPEAASLRAAELRGKQGPKAVARRASAR